MKLCLVCIETNIHTCNSHNILELNALSAEKEHWNILITECKSLSSNWEKVSGYLGLSFELIETIKCDNPRDSAGCWNEALKQWIKQNYNAELFGRPSWKSLLRAVAEVDKQQFQKLAAEHQSKKIKKNIRSFCMANCGTFLLQLLVNLHVAAANLKVHCLELSMC